MAETTTAITHVAASPEKAWLDQAFAPATIITLLGIVATIITIWSALRKAKRENDEGAQARTQEIKAEFAKTQASMEDRVKGIEVTIRDFMPRVEIEAKIEHEKANRMLADSQLQRLVETNTRDIVEIKVCIGKIEQKQDGMSGDVAEIKNTLRGFDAKLDRLAEAVNRLGARA